MDASVAKRDTETQIRMSACGEASAVTMKVCKMFKKNYRGQSHHAVASAMEEAWPGPILNVNATINSMTRASFFAINVSPMLYVTTFAPTPRSDAIEHVWPRPEITHRLKTQD